MQLCGTWSCWWAFHLCKTAAGSAGETAGVVTIDDVRDITSRFPAAYEQASYGGRPSWRTKVRSFAWVRDEPEALVVWVGSVEEKLALIESEPGKFFTTAHYDGHPVVLVRLDGVDRAEAGELIEESFRLRAPKRLVAELDRDK